MSRSQRRKSLRTLRVQRAEGLVEQQHARLDGERARERDALTLAAGELRRIAAAEAVELHELSRSSVTRALIAARDGRVRLGRTLRP